VSAVAAPDRAPATGACILPGEADAMESKLPPGQHAIEYFPRFGVPTYASRMPRSIAVELTLEGDLTEAARLGLPELHRVRRTAITADFHCVTTWTYRDVHWEGWALRDLYDAFIAPRARAAPAHWLELRAQDGYRTSLLLEDALAGNVIVADRRQGEPLTVEHGAPLRLVAPDLYGYKNVKHLTAIGLRAEFRAGRAEQQTRAHPRGRVAHEERGRGLPGWAYRGIYRAMFPLTLWYYRRFDATARREP
jgi:DMSO/TMAO reductase YedYZ molybdopterin-dependent catalytic subunit